MIQKSCFFCMNAEVDPGDCGSWDEPSFPPCAMCLDPLLSESFYERFFEIVDNSLLNQVAVKCNIEVPMVESIATICPGFMLKAHNCFVCGKPICVDPHYSKLHGFNDPLNDGEHFTCSADCANAGESAAIYASSAYIAEEMRYKGESG